MNKEQHRFWVLAKRPDGWPDQDTFRLETGDIPHPNQGEVLVRTLYLSVDPYMRGRLRDVKSYAPPVQIGETMVGGIVGEVLETKHPDYQVGEVVEGRIGWQSHGLSKGDDLHKVDPKLGPISTALGVLGMPGLTAYFGLLEIGKANPGDTVVVSGAAGAVGSLVGQIAKIRGCRAIGIAGGAAKTAWITQDLGFDGAVDYKSSANIAQDLAVQAPNGVDCYFDNVGGPITDALIPMLNERARVVVCGQISQYNLEKADMGPRLYWPLIAKRARIEGFVVFDFFNRYKEGHTKLSTWVKEGRLKYRETVSEGLENAPTAFIEMMQGKNLGKQVVQVASSLF